MKKKIVFIAPHLSTGGMPQYLVKQIELINDVCEVYCVEWDNVTGGVLVVQRNKMVKVLGDRLITLGENKHELFDIINTIRPDIIHLQEIPELFMQGDVADKLYSPDRNYSIIETSHDSGHTEYSGYNPDNKIYLPDKFLMVNKYQENLYKRFDIPCDVVEYPIENKVRTKTREHALRDLGLDPNLKHVINVGLFTPGKNQAEIIEYARMLQHYPIQFHFIGNQANNFKFYWEPLMKEFPSNCKWWNERSDVDSFYEAADLFLFTSRMEAMPLVVRESLGWKVPSLIYNLPVYMDYFDKYDTIEYLTEDVQKNAYRIAEKLGNTLPQDSSDMKTQLLNQYNNTTVLKKPSARRFNFNCINGMFAEILGGTDTKYSVKFVDKKTNDIVFETEVGRNCWAKPNIKYYVDWRVEIRDKNSEYVKIYDLDLQGNRVYIALDSKSLGDTLAWIPYVDEFRKKHACKVICSTFWNPMLTNQYTDIEFVQPGTAVNNILAMYNIGLFYDDNGKINGTLHKNNPLSEPLQKWASDILGLEYEEIRPRLNVPNIDTVKPKQVSIAIHSTAQAKYWNNPTGWQDVVDWLKDEGYAVKLLSKENDGYMGNPNPTGIEQLPSSSTEAVISELRKSELFIGLGSGLSWLSWAVGTPTIIISGFSDPFTEPTSCIRIAAPNTTCHGCFNRVRLNPSDWNWCPDHKNTPRQYECSKQITSEMVINAIKKVLTSTSVPQEINGWFSYEDLYNKAVAVATGGETFVEVGAWLGKSTNHMIKKIQESEKLISFTTVDTWEGTINEPDHREFKKMVGGELFPEFVKNLVERGHAKKVNIIKDTSKNAATHFSNNSIDYIMIDGDHSYDAVNSDLHTWFHKVKSGGIISGDDYCVFDGVTKAVDEYFYGQVDHANHSFVKRKPRIQIKHLLSRPTDLREIISVESIKQLQRYGFDYQQIYNGVYDGPVPTEFCRRPDDINATEKEFQPGLGPLTSRHYGCYLAHVNAIRSIDDVQFDYTIIFEGDALLSVGVEEFANMIYKSCFISERDTAFYIGLANNNSIAYEQINSMFKKTAHNQVLAHAYLISNRNKQWWLNRINDCEWDSADLWLNHVFFKYPELRYATNKVYSIQTVGESLIDRVVKRWENGLMI